MLPIILSRILQQKKISLFVLFFLPILINLGFWQLDRATEKEQLLAVYQEQVRLPVKSLVAVAETTPVYYGELKTKGQYDGERYWLLDNQPRDGKVGYEILMPFASEIGVIIVNRGWVPAALDRAQLPVIETPREHVEIIGSLAAPVKNNIINNNASDLAIDWPKRVLQLDINTVEKSLNTRVLPSIFRIRSGSPGAFVTEWPVANSTAEKHRGYAMQWFAMSFALVILFIVALFKRDNNNEKTL